MALLFSRWLLDSWKSADKVSVLDIAIGEVFISRLLFHLLFYFLHEMNILLFSS